MPVSFALSVLWTFYNKPAVLALHAIRCSAMQDLASEVDELRESIPGPHGPPVVRPTVKPCSKTKTSQAMKAPPPDPPLKKHHGGSDGDHAWSWHDMSLSWVLILIDNDFFVATAVIVNSTIICCPESETKMNPMIMSHNCYKTSIWLSLISDSDEGNQWG